jgi:flagellar biosynthesis protein FlhF
MMRLKSYFAGTVESAICLARQEMGEEAMLVSSRKTPPEAKHLGVYVVFASAQEPSREALAASRQGREEPVAPQSFAAQTSFAGQQSIVSEMVEMRRQLAKMSTLVSRTAVRNGLRASTAPNPALDDLDQLMATNEVDGDLACCILRALESLDPAASSVDVRRAFREDIQNRFTVSAELSPWSVDAAGASGSTRRIVALVDPPGAGKTTMLAKLAVRFGISARRTTHIVSYDSHRIASGEQLRSYAAILGVGFEAIDSVGALAQSLKENSRKDLVLVDTPGYSAKDFDLSWELTKFLATYPHVDIHLVLSCGVKSTDISRMVDRYNVFCPAKLLFTRLDETDSFGVILNESVRTGMPVSFPRHGPPRPRRFRAGCEGPYRRSAAGGTRQPRCRHGMRHEQVRPAIAGVGIWVDGWALTSRAGR